jgi:hypothetical protein
VTVTSNPRTEASVTPLGYAPVAQRIERQPPELEVAGSSPVGGTTSTRQNRDLQRVSPARRTIRDELIATARVLGPDRVLPCTEGQSVTSLCTPQCDRAAFQSEHGHCP